MDFRPKPDGWIAVRQRRIEHPSELLEYADTGRQIRALVDADEEDVVDLLFGVGEGEYRSGNYVGWGCRPHLCHIEQVFLFADVQDREVFLAWKLEGQDLKMGPAIEDWPDNAMRALQRWVDDYNETR